ncbi:MAG TPA: hypothetical protein VF575_02245 [Candidatus Saccharimonadales bacterium]|jgi:chromosome segregation ATPase
MRIKIQIGMTLVSVLAAGMLAVVPASARGMNSGGDDTADMAVISESSQPSAESGTETEADKQNTTGKVEDLRQRAQKKVQADRQEKKSEKTLAVRQKACQAREANLNKKIVNYSRNAKNHLAKYDTTLTKLQDYQTEKQLTVPSYDSLAAAAVTEKSQATAAVEALSAVSVDIDCTVSDPAASVAVVKEAVKNARTALQSYRTSVKAVLVALMTAKQTAAPAGSTTVEPKETTE